MRRLLLRQGCPLRPFPVHRDRRGARIALVSDEIERDCTRAVAAGATIVKPLEPKPWRQTTGEPLATAICAARNLHPVDQDRQILMQITQADLRAILRADAVSLVLGTLLLASGLLTLILWAGARRRTTSLPRDRRSGGVLLGIFAFLYGLRLLIRTTTFRLLFDVSPAVWDYTAAAITYFVPLPLFLFVRAVVPVWRGFTFFVVVALTIFASYGVASDAVLRRPYSAGTINNLIAVALIGALLAVIFRPGLTSPRDLRTVRIGALSWSLTAVADNLRGMKLLAFGGPDLEPFGFTVLVACLGVLMARRAIEDGRRLVVIDRELAIARHIQSSILPQAMPRVSGLTLAARYRPMNAVAGDFFDFLEIDGHRLGVLVADVSGHGVPAALIASMVKVALASQQDRADHPAAVLTAMNETLCGQLAAQYVTAAYLYIDTHSGLMRYAAAGHPPMLRVILGRVEVDELEKNGLILGFTRGVHYEELEQPLEAGDRLLLYTDGLIEAMNASEDFFGLERVKGALTSASELSSDAAVDSLLRAMDAWSGKPANDDLTIVLVDRMA
jgi:phosphoserine phosphatase RsbU/P